MDKQRERGDNKVLGKVRRAGSRAPGIWNFTVTEGTRTLLPQ